MHAESSGWFSWLFGDSPSAPSADSYSVALSEPKVVVSTTKELSGEVAARYGASIIAKAIAERGSANVILATGASQFEMLEALVKVPGIDWSRVTCFHLDEYVGVTSEHPASFQKCVAAPARQLNVVRVTFRVVGTIRAGP